jgi:hypothetical protein
MAAPLAYLITWTTYGTWLPGDKRGWVESGKAGVQLSDAPRQELAERLMRGTTVILNPAQREVVEGTIRKHC